MSCKVWFTFARHRLFSLNRLCRRLFVIILMETLLFRRFSDCFFRFQTTCGEVSKKGYGEITHLSLNYLQWWEHRDFPEMIDEAPIWFACCTISVNLLLLIIITTFGSRLLCIYFKKNIRKKKSAGQPHEKNIEKSKNMI